VARLVKLAGWRRLAVTAACLATWRLLDQIPLVGLNPPYVELRVRELGPPGPLGAISDSLPVASYSVGLMGITPYINAVVVMLLLRVISGTVHGIASTKEGRLRLSRWTRALAVAMAVASAFGWVSLLQSENALPSSLDSVSRLVVILELTAGTVVVMFLAEILDEFGLGFGYGAFLIYDLGPVATQTHRLAAILASAPSLEALYRPLAVWLSFSILVAALSVAVLRATRRVTPEGEDGEPAKPIELKLLMSGVLRPFVFADAVLFLPRLAGHYYPGASSWISDHWTPLGTNPWTDALFVATWAVLVAAFVVFVVISDLAGAPISRNVSPHITRLMILGGLALVLLIVVLPVLEEISSRAAGMQMPMSGFDAVFMVAVVFAIVSALEHPKRKVSATQAALLPRLL